MNDEIKNRLEYLRDELRAERISYGEIAELQSLVAYIDPSDTELLEAAGVPEHRSIGRDNKGIMLEPRQLATVLAALRYWQAKGLLYAEPDFMDIATDGTLEPLTTDEIDTLCEQINL